MARDDGFDPLYQEIGMRLAHARGAAGLSQAKLAAKVKVTRTSVVNIERGRQRPPVHLLWELAGVLGIEVGSLLPQRRELAERGAPVQLDATVVAYIEQAAKDDPSTKRLLLDFIQQATAKIDTADASAAPARRPTTASRATTGAATSRTLRDPRAER